MSDNRHLMPDDVDDKLVSHLGDALRLHLKEKFSGDTAAKVAWLQRYAERVKSGDLSPKSPCHVVEGRLALKMVLKEMKEEMRKK